MANQESYRASPCGFVGLDQIEGNISLSTLLWPPTYPPKLTEKANEGTHAGKETNIWDDP